MQSPRQQLYLNGSLEWNGCILLNLKDLISIIEIIYCKLNKLKVGYLIILIKEYLSVAGSILILTH